jgi:pyruvate, orthophosphate dikinase
MRITPPLLQLVDFVLSAVGQVVFDSATAEKLGSAGTSVILLRHETSPEDVKGMNSAKGVLTQLGGMTSHAAVVARGWGKPCVVGCAGLSFHDADHTVSLGGKMIKEGDTISINGSTGEVILGVVSVVPPTLQGNVKRFMSWVDEYRKISVLANADTPADADKVRIQCGRCLLLRCLLLLHRPRLNYSVICRSCLDSNAL